MFWASFDTVGLGRLRPIKRMMNRTKYESLLKAYLLPILNNFCPQGDGVLQQDNATHHTSKHMQKFFQAERDKLLEWTRNSPDLNPIEYLRNIAKQRLIKHDCNAMEKLINAIIQVWYHDHELPKM